MVSSDPVDCLVEICETVMKRMNKTDDPPSGNEAYTLGLIMGTATRHSRVLERLREIEIQEELGTKVRTI